MNIIEQKETKKSEIMLETYSKSIPHFNIKSIVDFFPNNTFACFFNSSFDDFNFVFICNSEWYFWDQNTSNISNWCWETDCHKIIQSYEDDHDEINRFINGWELSDQLEYPNELNDFFFKNLKFNSKQEYLDIKSFIQNPHSIEERAVFILNDSSLTDLQKVENIFKLKKN